MSKDIYVRLREFMDAMPAGYPTTPNGVEIRILKKLFTPDDAEMVMKLKTEPEAVSAIAARLGICQGSGGVVRAGKVSGESRPLR